MRNVGGGRKNKNQFDDEETAKHMRKWKIDNGFLAGMGMVNKSTKQNAIEDPEDDNFCAEDKEL